MDISTRPSERRECMAEALHSPNKLSLEWLLSLLAITTQGSM